MRVLIKGGYVIDPKTNTDGVNDILIEDGIITEIGNISDELVDLNCDVIDAKGKYVLPGLVDAHSH